MFTVMQICPSWFGILTPSFCSSLWRMYFLPLYIWIRTCCVTEITFTPARSAFFIQPCIWACCSSVLVDRQDSVGAPDNVGNISHMQTNKTCQPICAHLKFVSKHVFVQGLLFFQSPTTSCTRCLEPEIEGWWFWVGPLLGLAKWVPRGEAQGDDLQQPPRVSLAHHRDGARCHCRQHLPSLSLLEIEILSAPYCDCLQFCLCCIRFAWSSCWSTHIHIQRTQRMTQWSWLRSQNPCVLSGLCGNGSSCISDKVFAEHVGVCFHLNLGLVSGALVLQFHGSHARAHTHNSLC